MVQLEIWKEVEGFPKYQVSNLGNVKDKTGKLMTPQFNKDGYLTVSTINNKRKTWMVHRLVLYTFLGNSELEVNHKDKTRNNNTLENLEYVTRSQNCTHREAGKKRFVSFHKRDKKFCVFIKGISPPIRGSFTEEKDAYEFAYLKYKQHFGIYPWSIR